MHKVVGIATTALSKPRRANKSIDHENGTSRLKTNIPYQDEEEEEEEDTSTPTPSPLAPLSVERSSLGIWSGPLRVPRDSTLARGDAHMCAGYYVMFHQREPLPENIDMWILLYDVAPAYHRCNVYG